jgi:hypothetical protein
VLTAAPYTVADFELANTASEVTHVQSTGTVRVEGTSVDDHPVHDSYYCTQEGGCSCPSGQEYTGPPTKDLPQTPSPALAITGGPDGTTASVTGTKYKTFCKPALLKRSCVGLLPGFSNELSEGIQQVLGAVAEHSLPVVTQTANYFSSQCFFQARGTLVLNAKGKQVFRGLIAVSVTVESWSSASAAIAKMAAYRPAGFAAVPGIGNEAAFHDGTAETNAEGEAECGSLGAVRVGNTIGQFAIGGVAAEGCGTQALGLLSAVAGEL